MRHIIHHFCQQLSFSLVKNIQGCRILLKVPKSVKRKPQCVAYYGTVYKVVAAEQQRASRGIKFSDTLQGINGSNLDLPETFPSRHFET
jgi:hypothetical protein